MLFVMLMQGSSMKEKMYPNKYYVVFVYMCARHVDCTDMSFFLATLIFLTSMHCHLTVL